MNIAVLDDLKEEAELLKKLIEETACKNYINCKVFTYTDISTFNNEIKTKSFSAFFLDIIMPEANGLNIARKIRESNRSVPIIFVTTDRGFALEGYDVQAFDYVIKPPEEKRISLILNRLCNITAERVITIKKNRMSLDIPASTVLYAQSRGHNVEIYTITDTYSVYMSFKDFLNLLPRDEFCVYSRGGVVNLGNVSSISDNFFIMNTGIQLHISRSKTNEVKTQYANYIFKKTRGCL